MRTRVDAIIRLPELHPSQEVFGFWDKDNPEAQCLVAPCGTKTGKSFGSSVWFSGTTLEEAGLYNVWVGPTLYKARIGYRYVKAMLPDINTIDPKDNRLEINFAHGSFMKFLHGRDAETTVEGEAIDRFVIDEAGKQKRQLWYSLFTTITQTMGRGIITGTPRGRQHWYYEVFRRAQMGDPFFCWAHLPTSCSPYVLARAIEQARRILPPALFQQYYEALFVSDSTVYGDLEGVWQDQFELTRKAFWLHPDADARNIPVCIGVDLAKRQDATVFFAINVLGQTVGYARFRNRTYRDQMKFLARFTQYSKGEDNKIRYDRTGVGDAVGETLSEEVDRVAGDWTVEGVVFTNAVKQNMVSRNKMAIETGWWKCPRIERVEHEFNSLEVAVTKTGLHSYAAPKGEMDDAHWAASLGISGAYGESVAASAEEMIAAAMGGKLLTSDDDDDDLIDEPGDDLERQIAGEIDDEDFDFDPEEMD